MAPAPAVTKLLARLASLPLTASSSVPAHLRASAASLHSSSDLGAAATPLAASAPLSPGAPAPPPSAFPPPPGAAAPPPRAPPPAAAAPAATAPPPPPAEGAPAKKRSWAWAGWIIPGVGLPYGAYHLWDQHQQDLAVEEAMEADRQAALARRPTGSASNSAERTVAEGLVKAKLLSKDSKDSGAAGAAANGARTPGLNLRGLSEKDALQAARMFAAEEAEDAASASSGEVPAAAPQPLAPAPAATKLAAKDAAALAAPAAAAAEPLLAAPAPAAPDAKAAGAAVAPAVAAEQHSTGSSGAAAAAPPSDGDISKDGLLRHAASLASAAALAANTPEAEARRQQAEADAAAFAEVQAHTQAQHQQELSRVRSEAEAATSRAVKAELARDGAASYFKELLHAHSEAATTLREAEVKQADKRATLRASKLLVKERKERAEKMDEVRQKVNLLSEGLDRSAAALASGAASSRITTTILALEGALAAGKPFARHLSSLRQACGSDPVVALALDSIPTDHASSGVPTRSDLEAQFRVVRPTIGELAYFPGGSVGMLAHLVAKAASALKVDEGRSVAALTAAGNHSPGNIDTALAQTAQLLESGQLRGAADVLGAAVQGTTAEGATQQWRACVRARALADQAVALLRAHATALAAVRE